MNLTLQTLRREASETGFRPEIQEKVIWLIHILAGFQEHPYLRDRLVLKGGTALNLFLLDLPRLSVDVDLNYVGGLDRETMLEERPAVESAIETVSREEGLSIGSVPREHAGGKWWLRYPSAMGGQGNLELDLNFMFRQPLWPIDRRDSIGVGSFRARGIPVGSSLNRVDSG